MDNTNSHKNMSDIECFKKVLLPQTFKLFGIPTCRLWAYQANVITTIRRLNIYVFISVSYIDRGILIEIHRNLFAIYVRRTWWSNKLLITLSIRLLQSFVVFVWFFLRVKALTEAHFAHNSASYKHVFLLTLL